MIDTDKFCNFGINSLWFKKKNMNIQAEKIALAKMLLETENPRIIASIRKIFSKENTSDFWNDLSAEQKEEIQKASLEIDKDEVVDYDLFMQNYH